MQAITPSQRFAKRMVEMRQRLGMKQDDLAARLTALGVPTDQTTVSRYESGKRSISIDLAMTIAAALGQSLVSMFSDDDAVRLSVDSKGVHRRLLPPKIEIAPKLAVATGVLQGWMRGDRPLDMADPASLQRWRLGLPTHSDRDHLNQIAQMVRDLDGLLIEVGSEQMTPAERERAEALIDTMRSLLLLEKQKMEEQR